MADSTARAGLPAPVADVTLTAAHLDAARVVIDRLLGPDQADLAFVSGSLAAGLGHGLSDVDVYLFPTPDHARWRGYREGDFVVQVHPLTQEHVSLLARGCAAYVATPSDRWQLELTERELQLTVRYAIGAMLIDRHDALQRTVDSVLTVRRILMSTHAYQVSGLIEDALGALRSGDGLTAQQAAQIALEHASECALAAAGDIYLGRKFLPRRLARTEALSEISAQIWPCLWQPVTAGDADDVASRVTWCATLATHLVTAALLDGWDAPLERMALASRQPGLGGPVRSPWVVPVRFADSIGMAGPDVGYRATVAMVRLWLSLDGRPIAELGNGPARARAVDQLIALNVAGYDS